MPALTLVIGNKNYSSWSLRGWLALARTGLGFEEIVVPLDTPKTKAAIWNHSPSGKVPLLRHGDVTVWESLAVGEYLAEIAPGARLWPEGQAARAHARAVAAEMHAGFMNLRGQCPMNIRASKPGRPLSPETAADIERIAAIWRDCRARFGRGGDMLYGHFTIADAMYAPVVSRFRTYGITLDGESQTYAAAVWALPEMRRWAAAAAAEPWAIERYDAV
ncbi:MAG: glutathione S-transferase family protein [Alphaproteobacteria bacterium]|nr:glutathione S-transferase family protein [Alphaproteobacteria bacterium]